MAEPESKQTTAGLIVIGDEVLSGKVQDAHGLFFAKFLYERGVDLIQIAIIPDITEIIVQKVREFSEAYTYVFTTGGIGVTHDDVTYASIAKAFSLEMQVHKETQERMERFFQKGADEVNLRMATFPTPCEILYASDPFVPLVVVRNVHILPGIPHYTQDMIRVHANRFVGRPKTLMRVYTWLSETTIATSIAKVQSDFPSCAIGSYPRCGRENFHVQLTIEGRDPSLTRQAAEAIRVATSGAFSQEDLGPKPADIGDD